MKPLTFYWKIKIFFSILLLMFSNAYANSTQNQDSHKVIEKIYSNLAKHSKLDMTARLDFLSNLFLGKSYVLGALGEGEQANFDQSPLFRTDGFDCETYVDTVIALAIAANSNTFKNCISKIRYLDGKIDFIYRNHFTSLDWNPNNQAQGFITDITSSIKNKSGTPVAVMAEAVIDKPSWYEHLAINRIKLQNATPEDAAKRLEQLKILGKSLPISTAKIAYIPLNVLFDEQGNANEELFKQIPSGAIIEIVRPNWDLTKEIGTHLNVSHLGFVFWKNSTLVFRQASSTMHQVVEVPFIDYLKETRASPTIKGINIQTVSIKSPLTGSCST